MNKPPATTKVIDIADLSAAGKKAGATVIVDNTFATPINQSINQHPLSLGADLVLHSTTKFLAGTPMLSVVLFAAMKS